MRNIEKDAFIWAKCCMENANNVYSMTRSYVERIETELKKTKKITAGDTELLATGSLFERESAMDADIYTMWCGFVAKAAQRIEAEAVKDEGAVAWLDLAAKQAIADMVWRRYYGDENGSFYEKKILRNAVERNFRFACEIIAHIIGGDESGRKKTVTEKDREERRKRLCYEVGYYFADVEPKRFSPKRGRPAHYVPQDLWPVLTKMLDGKVKLSSVPEEWAVSSQYGADSQILTHATVKRFFEEQLANKSGGGDVFFQEAQFAKMMRRYNIITNLQVRDVDEETRFLEDEGILLVNTAVKKAIEVCHRRLEKRRKAPVRVLYLIKTSKMICDGHFEYEELIGYDAKNRITFFTLYRKIRTAIDPYTFARGTVYGLVPLAVQEVWDKLEHLKEHISPADQEGDDDRMRQKAHIVAEYNSMKDEVREFYKRLGGYEEADRMQEAVEPRQVNYGARPMDVVKELGKYTQNWIGRLLETKQLLTNAAKRGFPMRDLDADYSVKHYDRTGLSGEDKKGSKRVTELRMKHEKDLLDALACEHYILVDFGNVIQKRCYVGMPICRMKSSSDFCAGCTRCRKSNKSGFIVLKP